MLFYHVNIRIGLLFYPVRKKWQFLEIFTTNLGVAGKRAGVIAFGHVPVGCWNWWIVLIFSNLLYLIVYSFFLLVAISLIRENFQVMKWANSAYGSFVKGVKDKFSASSLRLLPRWKATQLLMLHRLLNSQRNCKGKEAAYTEKSGSQSMESLPFHLIVTSWINLSELVLISPLKKNRDSKCK